MKPLGALTIIVTVLLCVSCLRENLITDIELPDSQPVPVIFGLFTPISDSLQVNVRWSFPIGSQNLLTKDAINDAQIWLVNLDRKDSVQLPYRRGGVYGLPQRQYPLQVGASYRVAVKVPQQKLLTAYFSIPHKKAKYSKIEYGKAKIQPSDSWRRDVTKYWRDVSTPSKNYFYFTAEIEKGQPTIFATFNESEFVQRADNMLYTFNDISSSTQNAIMIFYLISCEKTVYDFLKSSLLMSDIVKAKNVDLLTYFKGVLPEYSNVENGLGFVGGYTMSDTTIYVRD